jgi:hypothetical protein
MTDIIALRGFVGDNGRNIAIGDKVSVSDAFAQQLIKVGKAKEIVTYPDSDNAHDNQVVSIHQEQTNNHESNTIINSDNDYDIHYQNNVTDIDIQNDDVINDEVVDDNSDNQLTDTNIAQLDDTKTEQQDNKSNAVIIQKNTAGKK